MYITVSNLLNIMSQQLNYLSTKKMTAINSEKSVVHHKYKT